MKTLLAILFLCVSVQAQGITEGKPVVFKYDHDGIFVTRIYRDGIQLKQFAISEIVIVSTNSATGGASYTFKITVPGLPRGKQTITARVVDSDGIESDDSNGLFLQVKPKAPWSFGLF